MYAFCWGLIVGFILRVFGLGLTDHLYTTLASALIMAMSKARVETSSIIALYAMLFVLFISAYVGIFLIMCPAF